MIIKQTCDIGYEMISLALIPSPLNFNILVTKYDLIVQHLQMCIISHNEDRTIDYVL